MEKEYLLTKYKHLIGLQKRQKQEIATLNALWPTVILTVKELYLMTS